MKAGLRFIVTDGPFTEAKELVGSFARLQAMATDDAIEPVPSRRPFRRCRRARLSIESRRPAVLVDGISDISARLGTWRRAPARPARKGLLRRLLPVIRLDAGYSGEPNPSAATHS